MIRLSDLIKLGLKELNNVKDPMLEVRWFIKEYFGLKDLDFLDRDKIILTDTDDDSNKITVNEALENYKKALSLRKDDMPFSYIVGYREFYGLLFEVNESTLIPRPESEIMVDYIIKNKPRISYLDMCTGSGNIGIAVSKYLNSNVEVTLSDISKEALKVCKSNVDYHNVNASIIESDLFDKINERYDVISINPPYVPLKRKYYLDKTVVNYEPHMALFSGDDGLDIIRKFISQLNDYLFQDGYAIIEIDEEHKEKLIDILRDYDYKYEFLKDYNKFDRFLILKRR